MAGGLNEANIALCEELFMAVLNNTEAMGQLFAYTIWCDVGGGEHELDINDPDVWYILTIFELTHEHVGGADDGSECYLGFYADLGELLSLMQPSKQSNSLDVCFSAQVGNDSDPCAEVSGNYKGREFTVKIRAFPPDGEEGKGSMRIFDNGSFRH